MLIDQSPSISICIPFLQLQFYQSIGEAFSMPFKNSTVESVASMTSSCVRTDLLSLELSTLIAILTRMIYLLPLL